ncbi:MAG: DUF481 domain-containing protein [Epsilonproteobacteria bacterium]|nr:DUF481 domain-containing protein [Campylobacterota bacterium]
MRRLLLPLMLSVLLFAEEGKKLDDVRPTDVIKARIDRLERKAKGANQAEELKLRKKANKVDTIVVKGTVLQGRITELTAKYVEFSLVYGTGSIRIEYKNIEQITTEHEYHIFYNGKETTGRIVGIKEHAFLVVRHGDIKELVKIENIDRFVLSVREAGSIENRLRNLFPYSRGNLDIGVETETGVKDKRKISISYHAERKKMRHRQILDAHYAYETTTTATENGPFKTLDKKELVLFGEDDYYFKKRHFLFLQAGYEFDQPRGIDYRLYPALGYGYRYYFDKYTWLQAKVGTGYVYESFYAYTPPPGEERIESNEYSAAFVGISAEDHLRRVLLIKELIVGVDIFYMPSLADPEADWLSRLRLTVEMPINGMISLKWVYRIVNDDNPVPEVGNNKTTTDIYLSINY